MTNERRKWTSTAAWMALPLVVALIAQSVYYWKLAYDIDSTPDTPSLVAITSFAMVTFATFGGLIAHHRPRNPIGWIFCGAALLIAFRGSSFAYVTWALASPASDLPGWRGVAWLSNWIWPPAIASLGTFVPLLFPDGALLSRKWRVVAWLSAATIVISTVGAAFAPGRLEDFPTVDNPLGAADVFGALAATYMLLPVLVALSVGSLILRARRAGPTEREQIKWIAYVGAMFAVGISLVVLSKPLSEFWPVLVFGPLCGIPVASAIAIYRYRLFDIDRLISRTFSYVIVSAILVGVFVVVALLPAALAGSENSPDWMIAVATLLVVALFRPVRRRVQGAVDRRFNRARYDATRTIEEFTAHLRDDIDLDALGAELRSVVGRTMQPSHVSLWVRDQT